MMLFKEVLADIFSSLPSRNLILSSEKVSGLLESLVRNLIRLPLNIYLKAFVTLDLLPLIGMSGSTQNYMLNQLCLPSSC